MRVVGASKAKNKLGQLLDWVEAGEEIVISRRGKVVARMVAPNAIKPARLDSEEAMAIIGRIRTRREGVTLGGLTIREMIDDGRK
jgi:antitoxin (DNA-binding transcriptional repressor) of toxin-antitoxin stability system